MKTGYFHRVHAQTPTRFWINNATREEARLAIEAGATGCTQNPSYTWKMLCSKIEGEYAVKTLDKILDTEKDDTMALIRLQKAMVEKIAEIFMPLYEQSAGKYGYVSIQGDPFHEDTDTIIKYARLNCEAAPNIMAKVPATKEGLAAIEELAASGVPINATEVMSVKQALDACEIYMKATKGMKNPAPMYFSHIAGIFDEYLAKTAEKMNIEISPDILWQAGISVAKKIYAVVKEKNYPVGFISGGARGLHHFTEMVGAEACVTINWEGTADRLISQDPPVVQRFLQPTPLSVADELMEKFEDYRKAYLINAINIEEYEDFGPVSYFRESFKNAWSSALDFIKKRRADLFRKSNTPV